MRTSFIVAVSLLVLLCVLPVLFMLGFSLEGVHGGLTLAHYAAVLESSKRLEILWESGLTAGAATLFALLIGIPYAFFCTRIRIPFRSLFSALYVLPLVLPPLFLAMGWTQFLRSLGPESTGPGPSGVLSGIAGAAFLLGLAYFPLVTLFARKAFLELGAGFEEAARVGVGPVRAFLRVTLPLALPSMLAGGLFVFLFSIADFSVIDYLSTMVPVKERVGSYSFEAFFLWGQQWDDPSSRRVAVALGVPIALVCLLTLYLIYRLLRRGSFATVVSGHVRPTDLEAHSPRLVRILFRAGGFLFAALVLLAAVGIPLGRLVHDAAGRDGRLLFHVREALFAENGLGAVGNSVLYGLAASLAMVMLGIVLAHHMVRKGPRRTALLLGLSVLPLVFGPILYGAGLIRMWNRPWLSVGGFNPVYQTSLIVILMLVGKYLPFALAAVSSSVRRVDAGYEEVAAASGVGWFRRLTRILVPLSAKGIAAGLVLGFVFSLRELDTIVMLQSGNSTAMMKIYTWLHLASDANVASLALVLTSLIALPFLVFFLVTARRIEVY